MNVVVFAPTFPPAYLGGGPVRTLDALVRAAPADVNVAVLSSDRDFLQSERLNVTANAWTNVEGADVYYASVDKLVGLIRGYLAALRKLPDVVYLNSFFELRFAILPQLLIAVLGARAPVRLLAPRGEFSQGALDLKATKKRAFMMAYRMLRLDRGVVWHASAAPEAEDIRRVWGDGATVIVRENETSLPSRAAKPDRLPGPRLRAVFLGRIVPKKGLLLAVQALRTVEMAVDFDIFGEEEDRDYVALCRAAAEALPDRISVRFRGPVAPDQVREELQLHDVCLMPTRGENFGHVIAEALSASCPVVATALTPWNSVLRGGGGSVVDSSDPGAWATAIEFYAGLSSAEKQHQKELAGQAFEVWVNEAKGPHVFDLLRSLPVGRKPVRDLGASEAS